MVCILCNASDHDGFACRKCKGCSKCLKPTTHKTKDCKEPFPYYDKQICDICFEKHDDCVSTVKPCKLCGHRDGHSDKACPFGFNGKFPADISEDLVNRFTPKRRQEYLAKQAKETSNQSSSPTAAKLLSQRGPSQKPPAPKTVSNSGPLSKSLPSRPSQNILHSKPVGATTMEEKKAVWKNAEKELPKRKVAEVTPSNSKGIPSNKGQGEQVMANFFEIQIDSSKKLYRYIFTVEFVEKIQVEGDRTLEGSAEPGVPDGQATDASNNDNKRKVKRETKRRQIEKFLAEHPPLHGNWASDYESVVVSLGHLWNNDTVPQDLITDATKITCRITDVSLVRIDRLSEHVRGVNFLENPEHELRALNIISWKLINGQDFRGGRVGNKFYPEKANTRSSEADKIAKGHLYLIRSGFFSSMRPGIDTVLLNVNTVTSAFYSPISLQMWMDNCWGEGKHPTEKQFLKKLKNVYVTLDLHDRLPKKLWPICGISEKKLGQTTFDDKNGETFSVAAYLERKYPTHRFKHQSFCINVGSPKHKVWYPANKLTIVDWQYVRHTMDGKYAKSMVDCAEYRPQKAKNMILNDALEKLGINPLNQFYQTFGITPVPAMVRLQPTMLKPPRLVFGKGVTSPQIENGAWNLTTQKAFGKRGTTLTKLFVFCLASKDESITNAANKLLAMMETYKIIQQAKLDMIKYVTDFRVDRIQQESERQYSIRKLDRALKSLNTMQVPLILVILPRRDQDIYSDVKRWGDCEKGIPTVCVTKAKFGACATDGSLCANICLKINSKLKGVSHEIEVTDLEFMTRKGGMSMSGALSGTMIVGADVTHPGQGSKDCPSMAAVVATVDNKSSHYLGSARLQKGKMEYIADLRGMMRERVREWYLEACRDLAHQKVEFNWDKLLPQKILFYRDGVSESQYGMVLCEEKQQILDGCQDYFNELKKRERRPKGLLPKTQWNPKLTLLVVTKRHHARFYPVTGVDPNSRTYNDVEFKQDKNLASGMVVDQKVVTPNHWSFYLQSHHSAHGTARSAHYVVMYDDAGYSALDLQKITNNLCYTGSRATKALSVCTPARYADFLCDRLRCYLRPLLDPNSDHVVTPAMTTSSSLRAANAPQATPVEDENNPAYVASCFNDREIWSTVLTIGDRKNPWAEVLDRCMFYL